MRIRLRRWWRRQAEDALPPTPRGQRLMVAAAAIGVTLLIGAGLLLPHLEFRRIQQASDALKPCAPGQSRDCVGGTMGVILTGPASSPRN